MPGATFKVHRDFQLNDQQFKLIQDSRQAIERVSVITSGFQGKSGTATSGVQEQTQVDQTNQSLGTLMGNFRMARARVGEILMALIVADWGSKQQTVTIQSPDGVTPDRVIELNKPEMDPATGMQYLSNDLLRTMLKVGLDEVPSNSTYRGQQLAAMSESVKSLPPQYQAAVLPFMVSLMDVPYKKEVVDAIRAASSQESPEAVEKRIKDEVQKALVQAGHELKARELDMKERVSEAQIKQIMAQAVQTGVSAAFAAIQTGEKIALNPAIAPVGDVILQNAGYQRPDPIGIDPNMPTPETPMQVDQAGGMAGDTSPTTPQSPELPQTAAVGANGGIETLRTD